MHSYLHGYPALQNVVASLEKLKIEKFEVYFEERKSTTIDAKDGKVESVVQAVDVGIAVRLLKKKRMGFSFSTSLEPEAIERMVKTAHEISKQMPEDPNHDLYGLGQTPYQNVDHFDAKGLNAPIEQKVKLALELEALCRKADKRVNNIRSASLKQTHRKVRMVDSSHDSVHDESTSFSASLECKAEENGDAQMGYEFGFSSFLNQLDIKKIAKDGAHEATRLLGAKMGPTLECPAVLERGVVSDILGFLAGSFSAEEMHKGRSMLAGRFNERVFADIVTILDDGLHPEGAGTGPFDAEGVPSRRTTLVDGGLLKQPLVDCYHAKRLGSVSTASANRSLTTSPRIGFSNLLLEPGRKTPAQLADGISRGVWITELMGVHTANPVTGDFSLGASGFLIEKGKATTPIKGFAVAGNILELLRQVTDIGDDLRFFGRIGAPSIRISRLSVGGS